VLHALRKKKYSNAWRDKKPSEIARSFDALRDAGQPRLRKPWRIATDKQAEKREVPLEYVAQTDQYDVDFLLNFARQQGYELEAREDTHELWFGPGARAHAPVNYALEWGVSLMEFKPTLSTAAQWRSVTVRGWNRRTQQPISETVDLDDPELRRLNGDLHELVRCDPREQQVVDLPVFTPAEAKSRARTILRDRLSRIVTASGRTIGLPHLKAGTRVDIRRLGARLSGTYLVTKTTHVLGEGGYTTQFECRREELGAAARPGGAA
jgi:phage protein D